MEMLFKISDSLRVMLKSKKGLFSFFKKGSSIASTQILYSLKKYVPNIKTLIDVGANQGQFALATNHFFPKALIHSFEPVPATFAILKSNTEYVAEIKCYNLALGSTEGEIDFYSNNYSHASSALKVSELQKSMLPHTSEQKKIQVIVKRLDDIMHDINLDSPVLLKLDVQGFEKEVLKGAINLLKAKINYLLFEVSFVSMYEGEPLFDEMHTYVKELGFELIAPVGFLQSSDLQILQLDILYKRNENIN